MPDRPTAVQGVFGARACAVEGAAECASPPFANSLADRRTANRRWISRVGENRQQSSDFRIGSLRAHVKPPLARTRLRNFGHNSLRSGASEPPPTRPPVGRGLPRSQRSQRGFALLSGPTQPIPTCRPAYEHSACSYAPPQENAKQTTRRMTRKTPLYRVNCARNVRDVWRASSGRPGNDARTMRK